jgi:hypothetical protein
MDCGMQGRGMGEDIRMNKGASNKNTTFPNTNYKPVQFLCEGIEGSFKIGTTSLPEVFFVKYHVSAPLLRAQRQNPDELSDYPPATHCHPRSLL